MYDGEIHSLDVNDATNYRRVDFDKQIINVSEAGTELQRTDSDYRGDREMNIKDMKLRVDNASRQIDPFRTRIYDSYIQRIDYLFTDSALQVMADSITDSAAYSQVKTNAATFARQVERNSQQIDAQERIMDKYELEIYKKYSIPGAIIAFILVGAPLGVMSKRKGMGMAIAISIIMFVIYWAFLIGGEDLADRGIVPPFWSMWSANFLIGGVGLYLLYIVVTEKPLFSYFRRIK